MAFTPISVETLAAFAEESNKIERAPLDGPALEDHILAAEAVVVAAQRHQLLHPCVLHKLLFSRWGPATLEPVGNWSPHERVIQENGRIVYRCPPPGRIEPLMEAWWKIARGRAPEAGIDDAWDLHHAFQSIHPFNDGNGRVGRLLLNNLLLLRGFNWRVIEYGARDVYYFSIEEWRSRFLDKFVAFAGVEPWETG